MTYLHFLKSPLLRIDMYAWEMKSHLSRTYMCVRDMNPPMDGESCLALVCETWLICICVKSPVSHRYICVWDVTRPYVWRVMSHVDMYALVTRLLHMCGGVMSHVGARNTTHLYVWRVMSHVDMYARETWLSLRHSQLRHDSFKYEKRLIQIRVVWMSGVNESTLMCVWHTTHKCMWISHVPCVNESCLISEWAMSHPFVFDTRLTNVCEWVMSHVWTSHVSCLNEPCRIHLCLTHDSRTRVRHDSSRTWPEYLCEFSTRMSRNGSCLISEWVMSHIWMSHVSFVNELYLPRIRVLDSNVEKWVMSHIWVSHVSYLSESCLIREWVVSPSHSSSRLECREMSHVSYLSESCLISKWVMSHSWMSCISLAFESRGRSSIVYQMSHSHSRMSNISRISHSHSWMSFQDIRRHFQWMSIECLSNVSFSFPNVYSRHSKWVHQTFPVNVYWMSIKCLILIVECLFEVSPRMQVSRASSTNVWDMTHSDMRHDSFRYETWLIQIWDMMSIQCLILIVKCLFEEWRRGGKTWVSTDMHLDNYEI